MTDRELLELAARAAGIALEWNGNPEEWMPMYYEGKTYRAWNPLDDDGDAFRLAISCRLNITFIVRHNALEHIFVEGNDADLGSDDCAATRRAIVLAAAEIGRAM